MPGDLGMGLARHHTFQIQGLPFGHVGRGGLDADGWPRPGLAHRKKSVSWGSVYPQPLPLGAQVFRGYADDSPDCPLPRPPLRPEQPS